MVGSCNYPLECILGAVCHHDMPNKFSSTICDEMFGPPKAGHNFFANEAGDGGGSVISCCPGHWSASEVVDGSDNVLIPQSVFGEGTHNVKSPLLEGFHGLDGQDRLGGAGLDIFFLHSTHFSRRSKMS